MRSLVFGLRSAVLAVAIATASGIAISAQANRPIERGPAAAAPTTLRGAAPIDQTGTWVSVVTEDCRWRMITPPKYDYAAIPLNAAGRNAADAWDPDADEKNGQQCKVYGAASVMRMPGRLNVSWSDDNTLQIQTDAGTQTRMLRYSAADAGGERLARATRSERTWQGQSHAIWQVTTAPAGRGGGRGAAAKPSGQLKVVTTDMRAGYLRKNGVPYSERAVLTEYFARVAAPNGDEWLVVTSIVDDPTYLNEPFVTSTHFKKEPNNAKFAPTPCVVAR
jgi:hypothetical protein